jgi:hypothetical protein
VANPNVKSNGGPVIGNVQLVPIIWGKEWPYTPGSPIPAQVLAFLEFFVGSSSPIMAVLKEYSLSGTPIVPGSVVGNKVITIPTNPPGSILDSQISSNIQSWITNQTVPQPTPNTVYVVFLPQACSFTIDDIPGAIGKKSCVNFGGYHYFTGGFLYVVLSVCLPTNTPFSLVLPQITTFCSHELAEVITDPRGTGWLDTNTNPRDEIGDICQGAGYPQINSITGTVPAGGGVSYTIQPIWSQSQNNCVFGPAITLAALSLPGVVYGGQPVTGTVTLSDPVPVLPPTGITVNLGSSTPDVAFHPSSVTIPPGALTANISATTTAVSSSVVATVIAQFGQQTLEAFLTVLPASIAVFKYTPAAAVGFQTPPNAPVGNLTLNVPAPAGGLTVSITSGETLLAVPVPDEIPIAAGALSPTTNFYLQVNPVAVNTPVTLTASVAGSTTPFTFEVIAGGPPHIVVKSLTINPPSVTGGATAFGEFVLASPVGSAGGSILVNSSNTNVATVPGTVTLTPGASSGSFPIHTKALQQPTHLAHCTIQVEQNAPAAALLTVTS